MVRSLKIGDLISHLKAQGIHDPSVLSAIQQVPRENFVLPDYIERAYDNTALPIDCMQTISQPYIVALMSQTLIQNGVKDKILEIGTGSGYQAAILATLFKHVWTIERIPELQTKAKRTLKGVGFDNIHFRVGDGSLGWPEAAPFHGILVTAAAAELPRALVDQLDPHGGVLVIPLGGKNQTQVLTLIKKVGNEIESSVLESVRFVPLITDEDDA